MRKQIEILLYQYKKQNGLDVYSELSLEQCMNFINDLTEKIGEINFQQYLKNRIGEHK